MKATDLKVGEHYAVTYGGKYSPKTEAVLVSTEPHHWDSTARSYVPGRSPFGKRTALYLVTDSGGGQRVVGARDIVSTWDEYLVKRSLDELAAKAARQRAQAQREAAEAINQPKLELLTEAAARAGCSDALLRALRAHNPASAALLPHVSLDDLLALAFGVPLVVGA